MADYSDPILNESNAIITLSPCAGVLITHIREFADEVKQDTEFLSPLNNLIYEFDDVWEWEAAPLTIRRASSVYFIDIYGTDADHIKILRHVARPTSVILGEPQ